MPWSVHCDKLPACLCNEVTNHTVSALAVGGQGSPLIVHAGVRVPDHQSPWKKRLQISAPSQDCLWTGVRDKTRFPSFLEPTQSRTCQEGAPQALTPQGRGVSMLSLHREGGVSMLSASQGRGVSMR